MVTVKNRDIEWHSKITELLDEDDTSLTDEEYERKYSIKELVEDGYYDPFRIDQADVAELLKLNNILSIEDAYTHNFSERDEIRLADVLELNWNSLDNFSKVVYHVIRNTSNLPRWRRPYPPTIEYISNLKEFLNKSPSTA